MVRDGVTRPRSGNFHADDVNAQLDLPTNPVEPRMFETGQGFRRLQRPDCQRNGTIDANDQTGWAIWPEVGKPHQAIFELAEPVARTDGTVLRVTLEFSRSAVAQHQLGRFRLSTSGDPAVFARHARFLAMKLTDPWARLAAAYRRDRRPAGTRQIARASPGSGCWASAICTPPIRIGSGRSPNTASLSPTDRPTATC